MAVWKVGLKVSVIGVVTIESQLSILNVSLWILGSDITWAKLEELQYLGNVIKESMRLYPAAQAVARLSAQNDTLGGYHIPSNTIVRCGIHAIQRSEKYWPDPDTFKPERFENLSKSFYIIYLQIYN